MNKRDWKDVETDQIYAVWNEYLRAEGFGYPVRLDCIRPKSLRLTTVEIIELVGELIDRLRKKEGKLNE